MSVRSLTRAIVFGGLFIIGVAAAQADITWNAYDGFISGPDAQSAGNTWQYSYNANGDNNAGYTLLDRWGSNGNSVPFNGWTRGGEPDGFYNQVVLKNTTAAEIQVHPYPGLTSTIGWLSPITGNVNASFSMIDRNDGGGEGVEYWLYKSGAAGSAFLKHGFVTNGGSTGGTITQSDISVAAGDMLYLRVGPGTLDSHGHDLTGVAFAVTQVPEPSTAMLISAGLLGLLCYAWRKRK
jgi:hypothetical protein